MNSEQPYLSCEQLFLQWNRTPLLTFSSHMWVDKTDVRNKFTGNGHGENEEDNVLWEKTNTKKCPAAKW